MNKCTSLKMNKVPVAAILISSIRFQSVLQHLNYDKFDQNNTIRFEISKPLVIVNVLHHKFAKYM